MPLDHLVGRRFRVGEAILRGGRRNVPCKSLEELRSLPVSLPPYNRSGLDCGIERGGVIRPGDPIAMLDQAVNARLVMKLRVAAAIAATPGVLHLPLVHPRRPELPAWDAGAHVDIRLPDGRRAAFARAAEAIGGCSRSKIQEQARKQS